MQTREVLLARVPGWLPTVWVPRLVIERLAQVWVQDVLAGRRGMDPPVDCRRRTPLEVLAYAKEAGVTWPERRLVACPRCRQATEVVRAIDATGWACARCLGVTEAHPRALRQEWVDLAEYVFGLRIGLLSSLSMLGLRTRLLRGVPLIASRARTVAELRWLAGVAAVAGPKPWTPRGPAPRWQNRWRFNEPPRQIVAPGPLHVAAACHIIPALTDALLHPDAFLDRFGVA